jgi:hypothetical protein
MADILIVPVDATGQKVVNVQVTPTGAVAGRSKPNQASIDDLTAAIESFAGPIAATAAKLHPKAFTLTFGVTLAAESGQLEGWVIGKVSGEVTAEVSLEW